MTYLSILPHLPNLTKQMNLKLLITILAVSLLSFLLQFWQPELLYIREAVSQGEVWRRVVTEAHEYGVMAALVLIFSDAAYRHIREKLSN